MGIRWVTFLLMIVMLLTGCSTMSGDKSKMTSNEEQQIKESAIQYIQRTYGKEFVIDKISKGRVLGDYSINGTVKDGKNTSIYVGVGVDSPDGDGFKDSYVNRLFTNEIEPSIKELASKTFDLRWIRDGFFYGYKEGVKRKYTLDIPSALDVLKRGDKDICLRLSLDIYKQDERTTASISNLLQEIKKMNFHDIGVVVYVYDNTLKSASKDEDSGKHLLERYNIFNDNVQTMDINSLESYKTVIKK
ncbi:hypothetical protein [Thermoactinomyces sp. DSM 45891]|uniref:hypothetical protein n=1 Tax=Thermoactinomyces sp. DSM 45891 TaxID=1761907 RepID=UPI0009318CE6|nr:hypothetical protein [Thermoactinomyces sp. DSM 45891]